MSALFAALPLPIGLCLVVWAGETSGRRAMAGVCVVVAFGAVFILPAIAGSVHLSAAAGILDRVIMALGEPRSQLIGFAALLGALRIPFALRLPRREREPVPQFPVYSSVGVALCGTLLVVATGVALRMMQVPFALELPAYGVFAGQAVLIVCANVFAVAYARFVSARPSPYLCMATMIAALVVESAVHNPLVAAASGLLIVITGTFFISHRLMWGDRTQFIPMLLAPAVAAGVLEAIDATLRDQASTGGVHPGFLPVVALVVLMGFAVGCVIARIPNRAAQAAMPNSVVSGISAEATNQGGVVAVSFEVATVVNEGPVAPALATIEPMTMPASDVVTPASEPAKPPEDLLMRLRNQARRNLPQPVGRAAHVAYPSTLRRRNILVPLARPAEKHADAP